MKPIFKILGIGFLAGIVSAGILVGLSIIGLIDPYLPLQHLLDTYNIEGSGTPSGLGIWYTLWSVIVFSSVAFSGIVNNFNIVYLFLLLGNIIAMVVIGILSPTKTQAIATMVCYYVISLLFAIASALILRQSLNVGALPPEQQEFTLAISTNLILLSLLIPFNLILYFGITILLNIIILVFLSAFTSPDN